MSERPTVLLEGTRLGKSYPRPSQLLRSNGRQLAFENLDISIEAGRSLGIVGASGAGKSSLGRCLTLHERPESGTLSYRGRNAAELSRAERRRARADVQLVFQDSARSFNPNWTSRRALAEPRRLNPELDRFVSPEAAAREVGLGRFDLDRRARDASGGQLKRLNLARALTLAPSVLVLDEPFAGIDLSLQAQVANLLLELQEAHGLTYILISHDLDLVVHLVEEVLVLDRGRCIERGSAMDVLKSPSDPVTQRLVKAISADPRERAQP